MRKQLAEKLANEVADWGHRGLIDADLESVLQTRYASDRALGRILLRWLGFLAVLLLASSALGFIGVMMGEASLYLAPPLLAVAAAVLWRQGTRMATDPTQQYAISGAVLVTFSFFVAFAAIMVVYSLANVDVNRFSVPFTMLVIGAAALLTAYRYGLRWPLLVGILMLFHAIGNAHRYGGGGSYFMGFSDERLTLGIATLALGLGLWHERNLESENSRLVGFGHVYIIFGLLYANLSLWFLSLPRGHLEATLAFAAIGIAQLVVGARLHDGRFVGFGIVFLSINLYTRLFESFWNEISKGTFLLIAGSIALALGLGFEMRARKLATESQA